MASPDCVEILQQHACWHDVVQQGRITAIDSLTAGLEGWLADLGQAQMSAVLVDNISSPQSCNAPAEVGLPLGGAAVLCAAPPVQLGLPRQCQQIPAHTAAAARMDACIANALLEKACCACMCMVSISLHDRGACLPRIPAVHCNAGILQCISHTTMTQAFRHECATCMCTYRGQQCALLQQQIGPAAGWQPRLCRRVCWAG